MMAVTDKALFPDRSEAVLDSLPDGVYVTDCDRRILYWNRSAERLTGWRRDEVVGRSCFDGLLQHRDLEGRALCGEETCPLHRAILSGRPSVLPVIVFLRTASGAEIPVEVAVAPLTDDDGAVCGGVETFRDLGPLLADLERARMIQEHAIHAELPEDARLRFALHECPQEYVSGDFCRVERLGPYRFAVMVADIMGHGVASALYTMYLRSVWEEERAMLPDPVRFVRRVNTQLEHVTGCNEYFATALYGVVDTDSATFTYVSAGHSGPFLARHARVSALPMDHGAVGMFPDMDIVSRTHALQAGDRLLIFTDGAHEVTNRAGESLGHAGLKQLFLDSGADVSPAGLARLEDRIMDYHGAVALDDDLTLLGLEIAGSSHPRR